MLQMQSRAYLICKKCDSHNSLLLLQVLSCYAQMACGQEESIEEALKQLLELAGQHRESVPVLLALASGFMLKKQTPKAR